MTKIISSSTLFFSFALISLGILLLLENFGLMTHTDWILLRDMWPLLFILLGTRLVVKSDRLFNTIQLTAFAAVWLFVFLQVSQSPHYWKMVGDARGLIRLLR